RFAETTANRVAKKLGSAMRDSTKLSYCLLGKDCKFDIGRDTHIFFSNSVHIREPEDLNHTSEVHKLSNQPESTIPDAVYFIIFQHKSIVSGNILVSFFREAIHYEISSLIYSWVHSQGEQIKQGNREGLFQNVSFGPGGFYIDEGFATVFMESQSEI